MGAEAFGGSAFGPSYQFPGPALPFTISVRGTKSGCGIHVPLRQFAEVERRRRHVEKEVFEAAGYQHACELRVRVQQLERVDGVVGDGAEVAGAECARCFGAMCWLCRWRGFGPRVARVL